MGKKGPKAAPMAALFKMEGKSPLMKQIKAEQKGLQKLASTEKGKKAVKAMGYTEDVDGAMLMNKDYAAMMGGYGKSPVKMDDTKDKGKYTKTLTKMPGSKGMPEPPKSLKERIKRKKIGDKK